MKQFYTLVFIALGFFSTHAQCSPPVITEAPDPDPICSGNPASLTATPNTGTIHWYGSMTSNVELGTGSPFQTANLTQTTSFFAEAHNGEILGAPIAGGGKLTPTSTSGTTVNNTTSPWGLMFDVTQKFVLNSVDVFLTSANAGNILIELKDANLNILETATISAPAGGTGANPVQYTVPLGFTIEPGTSYRLVVVSCPAMIRDLGTGNAYPYPIGSVGNITQGTINDSNTNGGVYYFLYNWNFSPITICKSAREQVVVTVNPIPIAPSGNTVQTFSPGETLADLEVTGQNLTWYSNADATDPIPATTPLTDGATYFVNQTVDGCTGPLLTVMAEDPLSTPDLKFSRVMYYPNPTTGQLMITNPSLMKNVTVLNMHGQTMMTSDCNTTWTTVDLSNLSAGSYIVKILSGSGVNNLKVVKL